jgi:hypothetical protein
VVAVTVGGGERSEFVAVQLGALLVVRVGLLVGGGGEQRGEVEQAVGGGGAVELTVGGDRAVVGGLGAAVVGVQVDDQLHAEGAQGEREGMGLTVGVAAVGEQIADRDAGGGHVFEGGDDLGGSCRQEARWMRRTSSGTSGPRSSGTVVSAWR